MRSPKNFLIVSLVVILLCSTTVFLAVLNPNDLSVSAANSTEKEKWNVKIDSVKVTNISGTVVNDEPICTGSSCKFSQAFVAAGDSIVYKVKVKNEGSIDAVLDSSTLTVLDDSNSGVDVNYEKPSKILKSGEETEFLVSFKCITPVSVVPVKNTSKLVVAYKQYN